ncbi:Hypothetical protein PBC10988_23150 [Planctomycetales bacterium 10988]|nr:Hypothetical protein PBC10988_23150 [Planctomycetales bacterium 10988]
MLKTAEIWAIHEDAVVRSFVEEASGQKSQEEAKRVRYESLVMAKGSSGSVFVEEGYVLTPEGIAIVGLYGPLAKFGSYYGTSTVRARKALANATNDDRVLGVMVAIDSPGGTVSGNKDLADAIGKVAGVKPTHAFIEDLGASAAYWLASQTSHVSAGEMALVGSIGTYMAILDASKFAEQKGFKVRVIKAGEFKGAGVPGTEITDEQVADFQRIVDELNNHFLKAVSAGRKLSMSETKKLADGRVYVAAQAKQLGLIDSVGTYEAAYKQLLQATNQKRKPMSNDKPQAATLQELEAACPGASAEFVLSQAKRGATVSDALGAYAQELQSQATKQAEENARLQRELEEARQSRTKQSTCGAPPLLEGGGAVGASAEGDPIKQWNQEVKENMKLGMSKQEAIRDVVATNPELHQAYLAAHNKRHNREF